MIKDPNNKQLKKIIADLLQRGLIAKTNDEYILTEKGWKAVSKIDRENIERVLKTNN